MSALLTSLPLVVAAAEGAKEPDQSFLVRPDVGLMIWTLLAFGLTLLLLSKLAFPRIAAALDIRQRAIEETLDHAERTQAEADKLLADYRGRLQEARAQADEIVAKARKTGDEHETAQVAKAREEYERIVAQGQKDIEAASVKAQQDLRREVANLTIAATEKVTRKTLTADDQQRMVEEALGELDFSKLGSAN